MPVGNPWAPNNCLDLVIGIVCARQLPLKVWKNFRTSRKKISHFKPDSALEYKCHIAVGVVLNFCQVFKGCFGTQAMPLWRSKQLVETLWPCETVILTLPSSQFQYLNPRFRRIMDHAPRKPLSPYQMFRSCYGHRNVIHTNTTLKYEVITSGSEVSLTVQSASRQLSLHF